MRFKAGIEFAQKMDREDPLRSYRDQFHLPKGKKGEELIYLCGNSLGLMPKKAKEYVNIELDDWAQWGVEGHVHARHPWMPYHELLTASMARIVGAKNTEVVVMNSLTVNLHLLMVSFYRPTKKKYKILMEYSPFPSDRYAIESQVRFHGRQPWDAIIELAPDKSSETVSHTSIFNTIEKHGDELALVMMGGVNYYTGQAYPLKEIVQVAQKNGVIVGFDLAHATGNLPLQLHDWGVDFAAWCSYKYLNSSPGGLSGVFIHERHHNNTHIPRFNGWWGHDKSERFKMGPNFVPIPTAEAWQLSNPPILPMAAMRASLELFDEIGMDRLVAKARLLTGYMEYLLEEIRSSLVRVITPPSIEQRGCQLSIQVKGGGKVIFDELTSSGVVADWREPDVIRVAPVPLYNSFEEVYQFVHILKALLV